MNTNFDFSSLKNRIKWKRAFAFFLSLVLLLTGIAIPDAPFGGSMTARASASGDAEEDPRGQFFKDETFPISYLEQEEIHEITTEGNLGTVNAVTWYRFTPTETATYSFKGMNGDVDSYGSIYTKNEAQNCYEQIASNDDFEASHFNVVTSLNANTTYYLCAGYYSVGNNNSYETYFSKAYITGITAKINGISTNSVTTIAGKSYTLEANVACVNNATPAYEWYTQDDDGNKTPLSAAGKQYTYMESGNSNVNMQIYCTITAGAESQTLYFNIRHYALRLLYISVDGGQNYEDVIYQLGHTYLLKAEVASTTNKSLTYTWTQGGKILQTGTNNTLSFTPTRELLGENDYFDIYCEVADDEGNKTNSFVYFYYEPITNVKLQINGKDYDYNKKNMNVLRGVTYTLTISATPESGKNLTYQWQNQNGDVLGNGQNYQYTPENDQTRERIYCNISDGTNSRTYGFWFFLKSIDSSLTVNGASASGNAIPVHTGETYQLKAAAQAAPGKTLTYQWGTLENKVFTPFSGQTGDTYTCNIAKAEDVLPYLTCRITDADGNSVYQKSYMRYRPIYNVERTINGMPISSLTARVGQTYALAVKAMGEPGKSLTYSWYVNGTKTGDGNTLAFTPRSDSDWVECAIFDGTYHQYAYFNFNYINTAAYDFTINGVSTNAAYAYEGQKVTLDLKDKHGMAGDIIWEWDSGTAQYKNSITITMGKDILKGNCYTGNYNFRFTLIPCTSHTYTANSSIPATASTDGVITSVCSKCGHTRTETIAKPSNIKLSKKDFIYTGKNQNVALTVSDHTGRQLKAGTDYDYTFSGKANGTISAKNVGRYTVKVTFKGSYSGTKELAFTVSPPKVTLSKVSAAKKGFKAVWKKSKAKVTGYEIAYSTNKSFKKKATKAIPVKGYKTVSKAVKKLKAKKTYYVKVRAYQNVKVGKKTEKLYSKWSSVKKVKTRK